MDVKTLSSYSSFRAEKLSKLPVVGTERFLLDVYCLSPGQAQKPHTHAESEKVYVVLEGECRFQLDGEEEVHGEGALVFAPAGRLHGVHNPGPKNLRLLVFITPPPAHA